jgi:hypothetical protein
MSLQRIEAEQRFNSEAELKASEVNSLVAVLARTFHNEPNLEYVLPVEQARRVALPSYYLSAIRAGQLYGEIHKTENSEGVAVWIRPEHNLPFHRMVQVELMANPFDQEWETTLRYMKLCASVEEVRRHLAPTPHWYLLVLGLETSRPNQLIGETLIEPVLLRADSMGTPCYLETFSEERLAFYKEFGFHITGAGRIPDGGPNFWAMTRAGNGRCSTDKTPS